MGSNIRYWKLERHGRGVHQGRKAGRRGTGLRRLPEGYNTMLLWK